jgi:hypothetical protein
VVEQLLHKSEALNSNPSPTKIIIIIIIIMAKLHRKVLVGRLSLHRPGDNVGPWLMYGAFNLTQFYPLNVKSGSLCLMYLCKQYGFC